MKMTKLERPRTDGTCDEGDGLVAVESDWLQSLRTIIHQFVISYTCTSLNMMAQSHQSYTGYKNRAIRVRLATSI